MEGQDDSLDEIVESGNPVELDIIKYNNEYGPVYSFNAYFPKKAHVSAAGYRDFDRFLIEISRKVARPATGAIIHGQDLTDEEREKLRELFGFLNVVFVPEHAKKLSDRFI